MRSGSPHTGINSSGLVRLLAGLAGPTFHDLGKAAPKGADRLGDWLDWTDAIALSAVLDAPAEAALVRPAGAEGASAGAPARASALASALDKACAATRAALAQAIADEPAFNADADDDAIKVAINAGTHVAATAGNADPASTAALCRQACRNHQRAAQARVAALRGQARQALCAAGPAWADLARLDALMDHALAERERQLLAALPALLERRARRGPATAEQGWAGHGPRLRSALLDELDLRLQPVQGMQQALQQALRGRP